MLQDRAVIKLVDKVPFVYGTPWCGSSNQYLNQKAALKAIVILEQAKNNEIKKLTNQEALLALLPRSFLPYYDNGTIMNLALKNLENIIGVTPIYLLKCKPDKEAVDLLYQYVRNL